ncbi:riboflavin aldehyde-forming enzyme [Colletotrichum karsti]|uniref:Riboflavin aldehyde-forming enzyme n=1 Tax=Colletotrichum karsti TaxID=1095194 RepID=A0A9P6LR79_9PEZI|nr:riboflavin aldehyde-forming enzyme [Colletotrichum karsti]KAF9882092.1 riboflavin aldehyde-forming enzyme [Colletotrichum karsti]
MKTSAVLCAALAAAAIAQPHQHGNKKRHVHGKHQKRAMVTEWVTETATVTEWVDEPVSTVWVSSGETPTPSVAPTTSVPAQFFEPANQPSSHTTLSTSSTPVAAPVVQQSIQQAPVASSSSPAPVPQVPTPQPAPQPTTTSVYVPPVVPAVPIVATTSSTPQVQPTTPAAAPSSGSGSGSGGANGPFTGKMTYYALGTGSCGDNNAGGDKTDNIVALSAAMMGDHVNGANGNYCHRTIKISLDGKSTTAYVTDKCPGCPQYGIDVSEKIFLELLGSTDKGHVDVSWEFA